MCIEFNISTHIKYYLLYKKTICLANVYGIILYCYYFDIKNIIQILKINFLKFCSKLLRYKSALFCC